MNKKIKIIELLNKIANREEVPKKIKLYNREYELESVHDTVTYYDNEDRVLWDGYNFNILNEKVEILKDNTEEIEELEVAYEETSEINDRGIAIQNRFKINELVKAVNKMKEGKE